MTLCRRVLLAFTWVVFVEPPATPPAFALLGATEVAGVV